MIRHAARHVAHHAARLGAVVAVFVALLGPAVPAQAHDVGGVGATNFQTTLAALTPPVSGLSVTVIENGSRLELRNTTATEVVIAGYGGEPYARVGPGGAFVNDNSPATYLNASRFSTTPVPAGVDPTKPPTWRQIDTEPVLRWHDHRIHWMLSTLPPVVAADPGVPHRISSWTINLSYGGAPLTVAGTLGWVPGPNPWPWVGLVVVIAAAVALVPLLARPHRLLAAIGLVAVGAEIVHGFGVMLVETGSLPQRLGALFGSDALLLWPFAIFGAWLLWKGHTWALWIAAAAGFVMATTLVIDDAPVWWRSSAPTALPASLNRLLVAAVVGAGVGLLAALALLLRRHGNPSRPWSVPGQAGAAATAATTTGTRAGTGIEVATDLVPTADAGLAVAARTGPDLAQPVVPALATSAGGPNKPPTMSSKRDVAQAPGSSSRDAGVPGLPAGAGGGIGRRQVAGALAAGTLGALAGAAAGATFAAPRQSAPPPAGTPIGDVGARTVAFRGERQAGIVTPVRPQARVWIAGFDLVSGVGRAGPGRFVDPLDRGGGVADGRPRHRRHRRRGRGRPWPVGAHGHCRLWTVAVRQGRSANLRPDRRLSPRFRPSPGSAWIRTAATAIWASSWHRTTRSLWRTPCACCAASRRGQPARGGR